VAATLASALTLFYLTQVYEPGPSPYFTRCFIKIRPCDLLVYLAGPAVFYGACAVVFLSRRPNVIASYLVFLPLPLLFGVLGSLHRLITDFALIAAKGPSFARGCVCGTVSEHLVLPLEALVLTIPSCLVLAVGLFIRTLRAKGQPTDEHSA
jgi:hypothetical protein